MKRWKTALAAVTAVTAVAAAAATSGCSPITLEPVQPGAGGSGGQGGAAGGYGAGGSISVSSSGGDFIGNGNGGGAIGAGGNFGAGGCGQSGSSLPCGTFTVATKRPPPISGGTLLALSNGRLAVSDPDRDRVSIVDPSGAGTVLSTISFDPGAEPGRAIEDGAGHVHVALRSAGRVAVIDPIAGKLIELRPLCAEPRGLAYDLKTDAVHVACEGGELVTVGAASGVVSRTLRPATDLRDVILTRSGLLVSRFRSAEILELDAAGNVVELRTFPVFVDATAAANRFAPDVAWRMIAVPSGAAVLYERASLSAITLPSGSGCLGQGVGGGGSGVGGGGVGSSAYGGGIGGIVQTAVSVIRLGAGGPDPSELAASEALVGAPLAVDIARRLDGSFALAVAGSPGTSVMFLVPNEVESSAGAGGFSVTNGLLPGPQAVAVAYDKKGVLYAQSLEPPTLTVLAPGGGSPTTIALDGPSYADDVQAMFHTAPSATSLACASCHPEGREDGHVWTFMDPTTKQIQRRRTQLVRLGILQQTAPFHWGGEFADMTALVDNIWVSRMGGAPVCSMRETAIAAWLDQLPPPTIASGAAPDSVQRGSVLFNDPAVGCATCHSGPQYTNNKTMAVGTGDDRPDFQVPSLIGVGSRAPYMHNGCAPTLRDRFTDQVCGGGDLHGHTGALSDAQLDDMIAFLQSL